MKRNPVEILAPAGSYESLVAAVNAGADAVYIGGSRFGARAFANNPDEQMMLQAIDYAHLHGCRLYMTVNTLFKEDELAELSDYLSPCYRQGLDAVIVQDMGAFAVIRREFPDLPIHASTQMTITGSYGAKILASLGAKRVVTARELSLEEIREIHRSADIEIESFVHGALCYCYSGQCLFSSLIGGRSGNRGRCAQPCRLPYEVRKDGKSLNKKDQRYVLSLKDLCTLDIIPDMIEAGVYSMKIEGRMKSPRYTAGVVSIYRKYVDYYQKHGRQGYLVDPEDKQMLLDLFDRGGLTEGYYGKHNGRSMIALKEKPAFREGNDKLFRFLDETYIMKKTQQEVDGVVRLEPGKPSVLTLTHKHISVTVTGESPQEAVNQPITEDNAAKQLRKTGNSSIVFKNLEVYLSGNLFMSVKALNELRRKAIETLEREILSAYHRTGHIHQESYDAKAEHIEPDDTLRDSYEKSLTGDMAVDQDSPAKPIRINAAIENQRLLPILLNSPDISEIYLDANGFPAELWKQSADQCHQSGKLCLLTMPHIFRTEAKQYFTDHWQELTGAGFDGTVIRSLEEVQFLTDQGLQLPMVFDYTLYSWNHMAGELLKELGASRLTMPLELNSRELQAVCRGEELVVYGYLPMMVTAQCIRKTVEGCHRSSDLLTIKDRMGKDFYVINHCRFCYNTIYNTSPLSLLDSESIIRRLSPSSIRLDFTVETEKMANQILKAYSNCFLRGEAAVLSLEDFTRGHFKRGVE